MQLPTFFKSAIGVRRGAPLPNKIRFEDAFKASSEIALSGRFHGAPLLSVQTKKSGSTRLPESFIQNFSWA